MKISKKNAVLLMKTTPLLIEHPVLLKILLICRAITALFPDGY